MSDPCLVKAPPGAKRPDVHPRLEVLMQRLGGYRQAIRTRGNVDLALWPLQGRAQIDIGPETSAWELRFLAKLFVEQAIELEKRLAPRPEAVPLDDAPAAGE